MSQNFIFSTVVAWIALSVFAVDCAPFFSESNRFDNEVRPNLFEGDIAGIVANGQSSQINELNFAKQNGVLSKDRWPGNKMYYEISPLFTSSEKSVILRAIGAINGNSTSFQVIQRNSSLTGQSNYVYITRGAPQSGCWSYVGRIGGRQLLNLEVPVTARDPHCMFHGIIIHELMHAVGFWHEQSRPDRDNHVEINWDNIETNQQHNFQKYQTNAVSSFGSSYDFDSLMHYGKFDFAKNRTIWTIRPKAEPNRAIGQRIGLSPTDITKLNLMYPQK